VAVANVNLAKNFARL